MRSLPVELQWLIDRAEAFAEKAHDGQKRKGNGDPYIVHPLRVAEMVKPYVSPAAVAAAYLHDVVEDTKYRDLSEFPSRVRALVKLLTKIPGEEKSEMIKRIGASLDEDGILIKVADRIDNLTDGADSFSKKWLLRYLKDAELLVEYAEKAGLQKHDLVRKLVAVVNRCRAIVESP